MRLDDDVLSGPRAPRGYAAPYRRRDPYASPRAWHVLLHVTKNTSSSIGG